MVNFLEIQNPPAPATSAFDEAQASANNGDVSFRSFFMEDNAKETKDDTSVHVDVGKYNLLPEQAIHFYDKPSMKKHAKVPPPTPDYNINYQRPIVHKHLELSNLHSDKLPQVSDNGVKFTIESLGQKLGYDQYEYDLVQFWLLDILTDCLWKAQGVFMFEEPQQKLILEWVTAIFKLIANPNLNLSRKNFLVLFKNILFELYEHISKTCEKFPSTNIIDSCVEQFLHEEEVKLENETSSSSSESDNDDSSSEDKQKLLATSTSTFSINSRDVGKLSINPEFNIQDHIKHLKNNNPLENLVHAYSDPYITSKTSYDSIEGEEEEEEFSKGAPSDVGAYSPSYSTPIPFWSNYGQFKRVDYVCGCQLSPSKIYCTCIDHYLLDGEDRDLDYRNLFVDIDPLQGSSAENLKSLTTSESTSEQIENVRVSTQSQNIQSSSAQVLQYLGHPVKNTVPESNSKMGILPVADEVKHDENDAVGVVEVNDEAELEQQKEIEVMKEWAYFKLMEQRNWDMDDAKVGWVPWLSWLENRPSNNLIPNIMVDDAIEDFVASVTNSPDKDKEIQTIPECPPLRKLNFSILRAIVDFVFEYFYENFHFTLIKLAFRCPPNLITQTINQEWNIPKVIRQQIKRPKAKKVKVKKEKRAKSKSSKKSSKSSKSKKSKGSKTSKSKKTKDKKKKGKEKKGKAKLTPEQKAELELKRLEAERLEDERQKREENRVYMFPLADAASETLFMSIFENWVKAKEGKKEKKGKKGKKSKKSKKK